MRRKLVFLSLAAVTLSAFPGLTAVQDVDDNGIDTVLIHPPFWASYSCTEHWAGQLPHLGDALGTDCAIAMLVEEDGREWMRYHASSGLNNEDWFGYGVDVLAPCDCEVVKIRSNPVENRPGHLGRPPATFVVFRRADQTSVLLAHLGDLQVEEGDLVRAGDIVGTVANNGFSRQPHIHIGAWRGDAALQIRFDQTRMRPPEDSLYPK